jgi:hypothetical protein
LTIGVAQALTLGDVAGVLCTGSVVFLSVRLAVAALLELVFLDLTSCTFINCNGVIPGVRVVVGLPLLPLGLGGIFLFRTVEVGVDIPDLGVLSPSDGVRPPDLNGILVSDKD